MGAKREAEGCSREQEGAGRVMGGWKDHPAAPSHKSAQKSPGLVPQLQAQERAHCWVIDAVFSAYKTQATHRLCVLLLQLYITMAITVSFVFVLWNV